MAATTESPTLSVLNKRIRSLRKKLNRITQMETQSISTLNDQQLQTLQSKPFLLSTIDELEKLQKPLSESIDQEIRTIADNVVSDLIRLVYIGNVYKGNECGLDLELQLDLDLVGLIGESLVTRRRESLFSHKEAVEECVKKAKMWVGKAEEEIGTGSGVTYASVREKLAKIMASEYFTTAPVIKAPVEVAGNDTSFQMPVNGSIISPITMTDPAKSSAALEFQNEDVEHTSSLKNKKHGDEVGDGVDVHQEGKQFISPETGNYGDEVGDTVEVHQGGSEVENMSKIQSQTKGDESELHISDTDDLNPWNHVSKKSHQNHRGNDGVRRGYGNGRGRGRGGNRGGYQNGHTKIYEQTGRNYNYRGRGGRGRDGNHAHQAFASHAASAS